MPLHTSFESLQGSRLQTAFMDQGYVIVPAENMDPLAAMQGIVADVIREKTDIAKTLSNEETLNQVHEHLPLELLNDLRLASINALRSQDWFRPSYYSLASNALAEIVGNEIAMQRGVGLSAQLPGDTSSLLPIHADVWDGDSPFEVVLWVPLVSCFKTKSMYIVPMEKDRELQKGIADFQNEGPEALFKSLDHEAVFLDVPYGHVLLFSQTLMHGNRVNLEAETRWSLNCRFKSVMSPYNDKKLGEFFDPISVLPATKIGLAYRLPGGFHE